MVQHNAIDHSGLTGVGDVAAHEADTTAVHGIADTSTLYKAGGTDVAVADGGTGSSTAAAARTALGAAAATDVTDHTGDATDAHDASAISFVPDGSIAATNVQAAIVEVRDEAASGSGIPATIVDAKGDSIWATAADTVARLAIGANGTVPVAASGESTGVKWERQGLLGLNQYDANATYSTSSGTIADVDATNMAVTFDAPASGNVLVRLTAFGDVSGSYMYWNVRESTTDLGGGRVTSLGLACYSLAFVLTGVSAGSHTYKWGFAGGTTARIFVDSGLSQSVMGPAVMEVWAAP